MLPLHRDGQTGDRRRARWRSDRAVLLALDGLGEGSTNQIAGVTGQHRWIVQVVVKRLARERRVERVPESSASRPRYRLAPHDGPCPDDCGECTEPRPIVW